jgi:UDP-N-acetylmuramoyl-tripeptide--D-alanyl-D-alanine ligase
MLNLSSAAVRIIIRIAILPWVVTVYFKSRPLLHMLQLEGYQSGRYIKWMRVHQNRLISTPELAVWLLLALCAGAGYISARPLGLYLFILLWLASQFYLVHKRDRTPVKKPLVFTPRLIRLTLILGLVLGCQLMIILWLWSKPYSPTTGEEIRFGMRVFLSLILLTMIIPVDILAANLLAAPLEAGINWGYFKSGARKIEQLSNLTVIAITGSYGKTSTKYILSGLLSPYYPTLMTPESYNTPMGICKVIRGELTDKHKYFIVEMGARKRGDIEELCRLVQPKTGVITAIGPQHLETFGSLDNIIRTKAELIAGLGPEGLAVLNYDDPHCRKLAAKSKIPCRGYGIDCSDKLDLRAEEIKVTSRGITFTVRTAGGEQARLSTRLLGKHNIYNVLAAATVALECGLSLSQIARALKQIQPVPHRLQLIQGDGGVTIIDDAYNSNPQGVQEALQVLKMMDGGRKILVTPGMVELGDEEYEQNKRLGQAAAEVCDTVILVGRERTKPIAEGLKNARFAEENLLVVASLAEASGRLKQLVKPGDVVLFENDLPDNYSE